MELRIIGALVKIHDFQRYSDRAENLYLNFGAGESTRSPVGSPSLHVFYFPSIISPTIPSTEPSPCLFPPIFGALAKILFASREKGKLCK